MAFELSYGPNLLNSLLFGVACEPYGQDFDCMAGNFY